MKPSTSRRALGAAIALVAAAMALSACSTDSTSAGSGGKGTWSTAAVEKASGNYKVKPIFAVPKTLPKKYSFVFLNNGKSNAYFATWSQGMQDAAKFYGVNFQDADLDFKYETELSAYQQLSVRQPDVVGAQTLNAATYQAVTKDKAKIIMIDGAYKDVPHFGVPDDQVGQLAIQQLEAPAKSKEASDWKGKTVVVAGMTAPNCPQCDTRVKASFSQAEKDLGIPASDTFLLTPQGQDPTSASQSTFADFLTAHPNDAVLVVSYGDEPVIGALNAAKAANREGDILAITNGGDEAARAALRDKSNAGMLVGSIDYQPYAEGWNWIEASIAVSMGKKFGSYDVDRVLTAANVDSYYPNDK